MRAGTKSWSGRCRRTTRAPAWDARSATRRAPAATWGGRKKRWRWPSAHLGLTECRFRARDGALVERLGKPEEAARCLADAFTIPDPGSTDAGRARDRGRMGELYRQAKGSENGLGDLVLQAYDRNVALIHTRELGMRASDRMRSSPTRWSSRSPAWTGRS